ncbi:MAG: hypothetical protein BGO76_03555 [Caedibacter sp. 38-128]|nr:DUF721 domain-containing protein [Holosporales bacterium]OJX07938.1 MAG: hypothetical protein BGO76_03555 [Caedibacter sp. 38-128]
MKQARIPSAQFIAKLLPKLVKSSFEKKGFVQAEILLEWGKIVGQEMSQKCIPEKLVFPKGKKVEGTLYLNVEISSGLLIEYGAPLIIDKINSYFGYQAVARLKLKQVLYKKDSGPVLSKEVFKDISLTPEELNYLDQIPIDELREALKSYLMQYKRTF